MVRPPFVDAPRARMLALSTILLTGLLPAGPAAAQSSGASAGTPIMITGWNRDTVRVRESPTARTTTPMTKKELPELAKVLERTPDGLLRFHNEKTGRDLYVAAVDVQTNAPPPTPNPNDGCVARPQQQVARAGTQGFGRCP